MQGRYSGAARQGVMRGFPCLSAHVSVSDDGCAELVPTPPPTPHFVIYVCINMRTGAVYVGQTTQSPIQRLRKRHTDARAVADCATFHTLLLTTDISDRITIPIQYCETLFQAGLAERTWWADLRHWAVNDIPPGISENESSNKQRACITGTVLHVLQELRQAK